MRPALRRAQAFAAALLACALVFFSYLQPALIVELGNRLWACF